MYMTGNNKLIVCQAQMIKIVQHYFDSVLFARGSRSIVIKVDKEGGASAYGFKIELTEAEETENKE